MKRKLVINGQFTNRRTTGQERFAYELVKDMDKFVGDEDIELVCPKNAFNIPPLKNIKVVKYGKAYGSAWEQIFLSLYVIFHKAQSLNLCTIQPILKPGINCIHDISSKTHPEYFKTPYSWVSMYWHRFIYNITAWFSPLILTVSEYSKKQLIDRYHIKSEKIKVLGNGWDHFERIEADKTLKQRSPDLFEKPFFFSLGSLAPNKNIQWIIEVAKHHPQYNFFIAGNASFKAYGYDYKENECNNIKFLGYISDEEVKMLMSNCKAFIFPSFFEGFGIPPLEALSVGAKIIVSNVTCLPEIFGDSAYYIDPYETDINLDELLAKSIGDAKIVLAKYRFNRFALELWQILKPNIKHI